MLFTSPTGRRQFFQQADDDPATVSYGDAVRHLAGVQLGLWSDTEALRNDVARILSYEVANYSREAGNPARVTADLVRGTDAFREAFEAGLAPARRTLGQLVYTLGRQDGNPDLVAAGMFDVAAGNLKPVDTADLYERVYHELRNDRQHRQQMYGWARGEAY